MGLGLANALFCYSRAQNALLKWLIPLVATTSLSRGSLPTTALVIGAALIVLISGLDCRGR